MKLLSFRLTQNGSGNADPVEVENTIQSPLIDATRADVGQYDVRLGDDILDPSLVTCQATLGQGSAASFITVDCVDVNVIKVRTYNLSGTPIDLGGICYVTIIAK